MEHGVKVAVEEAAFDSIRCAFRACSMSIQKTIFVELRMAGDGLRLVADCTVDSMFAALCCAIVLA